MRNERLVRLSAQATVAAALAMGLSLVGWAQGTTLNKPETQSRTQIQSRTTLTASTQDREGRTTATFTVEVLDALGKPASGTVRLVEQGNGQNASGTDVAGASLDATGSATIALDSLAGGTHHLQAVYSGDAAHLASTSQTVTVQPMTAASPDFSIALAPASLTMPIGGSGQAALTITPLNGFTGFLSVSCSGLPVDQINCTFTPINVQITSATQPAVAYLTVSTLTGAGLRAQNNARPEAAHSHLALAVLLPGLPLLFALRKRRRIASLLAVAVLLPLMLLGLTACNPRYWYLTHGPVVGGTPAGNYTLTVTAQTSNGVTAAEHSTSLAVTVQ